MVSEKKKRSAQRRIGQPDVFFSFQGNVGDKYDGGEFSCRNRLSMVLKTKSKVCLRSFEQSSTFFINWSTFLKMSGSG